MEIRGRSTPHWFSGGESGNSKSREDVSFSRFYREASPLVSFPEGDAFPSELCSNPTLWVASVSRTAPLVSNKQFLCGGEGGNLSVAEPLRHGAELRRSFNQLANDTFRSFQFCVSQNVKNVYPNLTYLYYKGLSGGKLLHHGHT